MIYNCHDDFKEGGKKDGSEDHYPGVIHMNRYHQEDGNNSQDDEIADEYR